MAVTFNPFTSNFDFNGQSLTTLDARYLKRDQTAPQTVTNGTPIFDVGIYSNDSITIKAGKKLILDGA